MERKPVSKFYAFFEKMKEVLEDAKTVILTDAELLILVNNKLEPGQRITLDVWNNWKSARQSGLATIEQDLLDEFRHVLEFARVHQKMNLTANLLDSKNKNQYGTMWILERKFNDLKMNQQINLNTNPTIQIQASNDHHKELIENIIQGGTIDISHQEVNNTPLLKE